MFLPKFSAWISILECRFDGNSSGIVTYGYSSTNIERFKVKIKRIEKKRRREVDDFPDCV